MGKRLGTYKSRWLRGKVDAAKSVTLKGGTAMAFTSARGAEVGDALVVLKAPPRTKSILERFMVVGGDSRPKCYANLARPGLVSYICDRIGGNVW
jgi:hypothetical protein